MKLVYRTASLMWHILPSVPRIYFGEDGLDPLFVLELSAKVVGAKIGKKISVNRIIGSWMIS